VRRRAGAAALAALAVAGCAWLRPTPAWELPPPPVREGAVVDPARLHRSRLANGLQVLVLEDRRLPRVVLSVTLRRGAGQVPPDAAGLAIYTAELLERGAGARDALALAETVDALGASLGASTDWDATSVSVSGLSRDLDALLGILADVVLRPRFDAAEAKRVRSELLASLEAARDDPGTLARWNLASLLYPAHPYGAPLEGTPASVARLDAAAARAYHARVFGAAQAIFSASGDVDPDALLPRVEASFGAWAPGDPLPDDPEPPSPAPPGRIVRVVDVPDRGQARVLLGHDGIARTDPERTAASLMNSVLGGGAFLARLMTRLRAEEGLTYSVGSGFALRRQPGPFVVSTSTRVPEVRRVVDLILAELERMKSDPPDADEFRRFQTLETGRFVLSLETSAAVAAALVELDVAGLPADSLDTYRSRVRALRPEDVATAARRLLHPERAAIVVVGPAAELAPQLEGLGSIEIVRP
jgi:zinc protease